MSVVLSFSPTKGEIPVRLEGQKAENPQQSCPGQKTPFLREYLHRCNKGMGKCIAFKTQFAPWEQ